MRLLPRLPASCDRGTEATRAILPLGSMTNIDKPAGSTKSVESPTYRMSPPARVPYELSWPLVESASTNALASPGSRIVSCRLLMSLTSRRPPASCRTAATIANSGFDDASGVLMSRIVGVCAAAARGPNAMSGSMCLRMRMLEGTEITVCLI